MANPTNPVGGPGAPQGPRSSQGASSPDPNAFTKVVQKVEKVAETENEGRSKQKYKTQEELMAEEGAPENPLSPMALFAPAPQTGAPVPSPAYSPPPVAAAPAPAPAAPIDAFEGLPHGSDFYDDLDISAVQPTPVAPQQAHVASAKEKKGKESISTPSVKEKKGEPAAPAGSPKKGETDETVLPPPLEEPKWVMRAKEKHEEEQGPVTRPALDEKWSPATASPPPAKGSKKDKSVQRREEEPREMPWQPVLEPESSKKKGKAPAETESVAAPAATPLPPPIADLAQGAVQRVAPYLNPEIAPLFYQMVGSIMVMTSPPGISRTEVLLNAEGFRSSVFYGSTITIEKYATAPDSLNIRLSGSPEAVAKFQSNITTLQAAFTRANFKFRVGRLEAEYKTDRPLFRRKERGDKGGDLE